MSHLYAPKTSPSFSMFEHGGGGGFPDDDEKNKVEVLLKRFKGNKQQLLLLSQTRDQNRSDVLELMFSVSENDFQNFEGALLEAALDERRDEAALWILEHITCTTDGALLLLTCSKLLCKAVYLNRVRLIEALMDAVSREKNSKSNSLETIINSVDEQHGMTPLMIAAAKGHLFSLQLLLRKGANTNLRNKSGQSALEMAVLNCNVVCAATCTRVRCIC